MKVVQVRMSPGLRRILYPWWSWRRYYPNMVYIDKPVVESSSNGGQSKPNPLSR